MHSVEESWMARALQLAKLGLGFVAPNPMVGAVLVHPERGLLAEGYHKHFGGPHAEVDCLNSVLNLSASILSECTLFVTLEPCSHFGKTPPCADRIVASGLKRVVIATLDPNPLVAGKGLHRLQEAGIEVKAGILEEEARHLNRHFFTAHEKKRPWITLKWAQTADGFIAPLGGNPVLISNELSRSLVHQMRARHMAIMVGRETLRKDNPFLNVRSWSGPSPIRIVVDPQLLLPDDLHVFTDPGSPTWVLNSIEEGPIGHIKRKLVSVDSFALPALLEKFFSWGIHSIFVEGGSEVISQFFDSSCWDELVVFQSSKIFGNGKSAPVLPKKRLINRFRFEGDWVSVYRPT